MTGQPPWDPYRPAAGSPRPGAPTSHDGDAAWWLPSGSAPEPRRPPRRRRGGRVVLVLVALLAAGIWWERSPDPVAQLRALTDPATYTGLAERAGDLVEDVAAGGTPGSATGGGILGGGGTLPGLTAPDQAPPRGEGESAERLLPAVAGPTSSTAYGFAALQDDGVSPVTWSPCRSIHYVVRTEGAPPEFADGVRAAVAEVSAATGLAFTEDGGTSEAPSAERGSYLPDLYGDRWAPVLVAVSDPGTVPILDGDVAGISYTYRARGTASGTWHLTSGAVYLDVDAMDAPSRGGRPGWVAVLRHELGHLVGLDHVDDPSQLMNPVTSGVRTFQDGDLAGLARLGQGACAPDV